MTGVLAAFKQNVRLFVLDIFLDVPATLHLFHARIELDDVSRQLDEALRTVVVVVSFHLAVWLLRCQARMKQKQHMEKSDKPRSQWLVVWSYCTLLSMSDGDEFCGYFMIFDGDMFMKYVNRMLVGTRW